MVMGGQQIRYDRGRNTKFIIYGWCGRKPGSSPTKLLEHKKTVAGVKLSNF